jgi:hypothetical protein
MTLLDEHWDEIWKLLTDVWAVETWRHGDDLTGTWHLITEGDEEGAKEALKDWAKHCPECKDVSELRKWIARDVLSQGQDP